MWHRNSGTPKPCGKVVKNFADDKFENFRALGGTLQFQLVFCTIMYHMPTARSHIQKVNSIRQGCVLVIFSPILGLDDICSTAPGAALSTDTLRCSTMLRTCSSCRTARHKTGMARSLQCSMNRCVNMWKWLLMIQMTRLLVIWIISGDGRWWKMKFSWLQRFQISF